MKTQISTEYQEQCLVTEYLEILKKKGVIKVFSAVPNNTYTTSFRQKHKHVAEGVRPGVPDMLIVSDRGVLFLEMKRVSGGQLSPYQKEWLQSLQFTKEPLLQAKVAKGFTEAKSIIDNFVK